MGRLNQDVTMIFRNYGEITIPKGTATSHMTAMGIDKNYNFVTDLSWIPPHDNGTPQHGLRMDADNYGINIPNKFIDED